MPYTKYVTLPLNKAKQQLEILQIPQLYLLVCGISDYRHSFETYFPYFHSLKILLDIVQPARHQHQAVLEISPVL